MAHWPQWVYIGLTLGGLIWSIRDHGKPRSPENAWHTLLAIALVLTLLIVGGFFNGMFRP